MGAKIESTDAPNKRTKGEGCVVFTQETAALKYWKNGNVDLYFSSTIFS
jgi:hypothetical protein